MSRAPVLGTTAQLLTFLSLYPFHCQFCHRRFLAFHRGRPDDLASDDRRQHTRASVQLPVIFYSAETSGAGTVTDLSQGGCFLKSAVPLPVGTELGLRFNLPDQNKAIHVERAVVRRAVEGVGVQFVSLRAEEEAQLTQFLKDSAERAAP